MQTSKPAIPAPIKGDRPKANAETHRFTFGLVPSTTPVFSSGDEARKAQN
jgi:hypothetical protein